MLVNVREPNQYPCGCDGRLFITYIMLTPYGQHVLCTNARMLPHVKTNVTNRMKWQSFEYLGILFVATSSVWWRSNLTVGGKSVFAKWDRKLSNNLSVGPGTKVE